MKRVAALGLAMLVLAGCAKSGQSSNAGATPSPTAPAAAPAAAVAQNGAQASDGAKLYQTNCSSCHQANGRGIPGTFPPLAGNPVVTGDPATVIHDVKYGLSGKLAIAGHDYNGMMPAWGQQLTDADIASLVTYIRSAWGNKASAVTAAEVSSR